MTHTAGPWTVKDSCRQYENDPLFWRNDVIAGGIRVAVASGVSEEAARANARLIAAAPELLAAAQDVAAWLSYGVPNPRKDQLRKQLEDAISHATPPPDNGARSMSNFDNQLEAQRQEDRGEQVCPD